MPGRGSETVSPTTTERKNRVPPGHPMLQRGRNLGRQQCIADRINHKGSTVPVAPQTRRFAGA